MKTVAAVMPSMDNANAIGRELEGLGIPPPSIHIVAGNDRGQHDEYLEKAHRQETSTGAAAASSASFGGGVGILAALVALAIPGVGPIIAGGAMATVITGLGIGAAAGGLLGAFSNLGISHEEARLYEEAVRRGQVFMAVQIPEDMESRVKQLMAANGGAEIQDEAEKWRAAGWRHPYPNDSSIRTS